MLLLVEYWYIGDIMRWLCSVRECCGSGLNKDIGRFLWINELVVGDYDSF